MTVFTKKIGPTIIVCLHFDDKSVVKAIEPKYHNCLFAF